MRPCAVPPPPPPPAAPAHAEDLDWTQPLRAAAASARAAATAAVAAAPPPHAAPAPPAGPPLLPSTVSLVLGLCSDLMRAGLPDAARALARPLLPAVTALRPGVLGLAQPPSALAARGAGGGGGGAMLALAAVMAQVRARARSTCSAAHQAR
jgi:hypothetical protein